MYKKCFTAVFAMAFSMTLSTTLAMALSLTLPSMLLVATLLAAPAAQAAESDDLGVLLDEGKVRLDFRYRYEFVDQDNISNDANASTLRTRLGFHSGVWNGFDFDIEVNDVRHLLADNFNAGGGTTPDRAGVYPVVPDPKGTRLNQAYINYGGLEDWGFKIGRQRINLDNQRFVGSVAWRQTEQVFDAGQVVWGNDAIDVSVTYVQWVRNIFGQESSAGKERQDGTFFVNAGFKTPVGKAVGYWYHIDNEDVMVSSTDTFGARLAGARPINDDWTIRYEAEYAHQNDAGNNPVDFDADYFHLAAAAVIGVWDFGLGWELLGGDDDRTALNSASFRTPLATKHKFNGWADQFLATPVAGLSDAYLTFQATPGDFMIQAQYHNFEADDGSGKYGTELDLRVGYKFTQRFRGDFYLASFNAKDSPFVDVDKVFVQVLFKL